MEQLFQDNKDIVYFYDIEDFKYKLNYYLKNSKERESIAKSGYQKIRKYYNTEVLMNEMMFFLLSERYQPIYNWIEKYNDDDNNNKI
jgi:spore maturation protein CgeB